MDPVYGRCWNRLASPPTHATGLTPLPQVGTLFHHLFLNPPNHPCWHHSFWIIQPRQVDLLKGLFFPESTTPSPPASQPQPPALYSVKENITVMPVFNNTFNHFFSPARPRDAKQQPGLHKIFSSQKNTLLLAVADASSRVSPHASLDKPIMKVLNLTLPAKEQRFFRDVLPPCSRTFLLARDYHHINMVPSLNTVLGLKTMPDFKVMPGLKIMPGDNNPFPLDGAPSHGKSNLSQVLARHLPPFQHQGRTPRGKETTYPAQKPSPLFQNQSTWNSLLKMKVDARTLSPWHRPTPLWVPDKTHKPVSALLTDRVFNTQNRNQTHAYTDKQTSHTDLLTEFQVTEFQAGHQSKTTHAQNTLQHMKNIALQTSHHYYTDNALPQKEFQAANRDQLQMMTHIADRLQEINRKIDTLQTRQSTITSRIHTNPHTKDGGFYDY